MMNDDFKACFDVIQNAGNVPVLTGAGVSTLSGIPDFRGENGFYTKGDLLYGVSREQLFDIDFFRERPEIFYRYAREYLYPMLDKQPSIAHTALGVMQKRGVCGGGRFFIFLSTHTGNSAYFINLYREQSVILPLSGGPEQNRRG